MSETGGERGTGKGARYALGATALAAVLGAGAYVVTANLAQDETTTTGLEAPAPTPVGEVPAGSSAASAPASASAQASPSPSPSSSPISEKVRKEIEEARRKMAEDGVEVDRPLAPKVSHRLPDEKVKRTQTGSLKEGGIVRMVTAEGDLTGQRELAWVAGGISKYRGVECSQTFKFSTNPAPRKRDNLLLCWRTSATKSVVAVVVDPNGKPSKDKAVNELEKAWKSMS